MFGEKCLGKLSGRGWGRKECRDPENQFSFIRKTYKQQGRVQGGGAKGPAPPPLEIEKPKKKKKKRLSEQILSHFTYILLLF